MVPSEKSDHYARYMTITVHLYITMAFHLFLVGFLLFCRCQAQSRNCSFSNSIEVADCSYRGFHFVPDNLPTSLRSLDLTGNNITVLTNMSFITLKFLKSLILDENKISTLDIAAFEGLHDLTFLSINKNYLSHDNQTFSEDIFKPLFNLESLQLRNNSCIEEPNTQYYPDKAFSHLKKLKHLTIDLCWYPYFGEGFRNLTNLNILEFDICYLRVLKNDTLEVFSNSLTDLRLTSCLHVKRQVEIGAFQSMHRLTSLDLSDSQFSLPSALSMLYGLQNNTMENVNIYHVNPKDFLRHGKPYAVILTKEMTKFLNEICIRNLNIGNNGIVEYERDSLFNFKRIDCIETIYFSENKFTTLAGWARDEIFRILIQATRLREINYSYMPFEFPSYDRLTYQHLNDYILPCPVNLTRLNVSHVLADVLLNLNATFLGCDKLTTVDLSYTTFANLYFEFRGWDNVKYLDVSGLDFTRSWPATLKSFQNVEHLMMQSVNLDQTLRDERTKHVFKYVNRVISLDISNNHLVEIAVEVLSGMPLLSKINASRNSLSAFPNMFLSKTYLQSIDLSQNRLSRLNLTIMNWLDRQSSILNVNLFMNGNRISCTCETIDFLRWLKKTKVILDNGGIYECVLQNGTLSNTAWVIEDFSAVFERCNSSFWLVFSVTSTCLLTITLIAAVIIYRFRWRIAYMYFLYCRHKDDSEPNLTFKYDAFVGYLAEDYGWVCFDLRKKLEDEMGFKLCLHDRDFELGEPIFNNIENKISESKTIIFVITSGCKNADWFTFEIEMARKDMIKTGCKNIILIIKEEMPAHLMPAVVKQVWDNVTCLIWPENDPSSDAIDIFWSRLSDSL